MENKNFSCSITVNTTIKEAFEKINQVSEWWVKDVEGDSQNLNDEFTVHFGTTWVAFKVAEIIPNKKAVWLIPDCNLPWNEGDVKEWNNTKIVWEISKTNNFTQINFSHIGLADLDCGNQCMNSWSGYIKQSLFKLITEGKGLPNKF